MANKLKRTYKVWKSLLYYRAWCKQQLGRMVLGQLETAVHQWRLFLDRMIQMKFDVEAGVFLCSRLMHKRGWVQLSDNAYARKLARSNLHMGANGYILQQCTYAMRSFKQLCGEAVAIRKRRADSIQKNRSCFRRFMDRLRALHWFAHCFKQAHARLFRRIVKSFKYWIASKSSSRVNMWIASCRWKNLWFLRWRNQAKSAQQQINCLKIAEEAHKCIRIRPAFANWLRSVRKGVWERRRAVRQLGNRALCQWAQWMRPVRSQRSASRFSHRQYAVSRYKIVIDNLLGRALERKKLRESFLVFRKQFPEISRKYGHIAAFNTYYHNYIMPVKTSNPTDIIIGLTLGFQGLLKIYLLGVQQWDRFEDLLLLNLSAVTSRSRLYECLSAGIIATRLHIERGCTSTRHKFRAFAALLLVSKCFFAWKVGFGCFDYAVDIMNRQSLVESFHQSKFSLNTFKSLQSKFYWVRKNRDLILIKLLLRKWVTMYRKRADGRMCKLVFVLSKNMLRWGFFRLLNKVRERKDAEELQTAHIKILRSGGAGPKRAAEIARLVVSRSPMAWGRRSGSLDSIKSTENIPCLRTTNFRSRCQSTSSDDNQLLHSDVVESEDFQASPFVIHQRANIVSITKPAHNVTRLFDDSISATPSLSEKKSNRRIMDCTDPSHHKSYPVEFVFKIGEQKQMYGMLSPSTLSPIGQPPALPCELSLSVSPSQYALTPEFAKFTPRCSESIATRISERRDTASKLFTRIKNGNSSSGVIKTVEHPSVITANRRGYFSEYLNRNLNPPSPPASRETAM